MFEFLFKYPPEVFSKGTFVLLGSWPVWILWVCLAGLAALPGWLIWRNRNSLATSVSRLRAVSLWGLQVLLAALLLLLLWQPAIRVAALKPQQNIIAVVVDDSKSMAIREGKESRHDEALRVLESGLLKNIQNRFQVRLYRLTEQASRIANLAELNTSGTATHIGTGLKQIADQASTLPIGAIVLLSDGADNTGGIDLHSLTELRRRRLPVSTIGFGNERLERDVEFDGLDIAPRSLENSRLRADVSIRQNGFTGKHVKLTLSQGGLPLASREIVLNSDQQTEDIEFNAGAAGVKTIEARIEPLAGEKNLQNNQRIQPLLVEGSPRRILYVEGEPRWEYKFLRRAVDDDKALHVVSLLRTTQNKLYRQGIDTPEELADGFPSKPEDLFRYDGLILGSVETAFFTSTQQDLIQQFADRRGGGILFLGGRASLSDGGYNAAPFSDLLPVNLPQRKNTFQREMAEALLTEAGKQSLICRIEDDAGKSEDHWKILPYLASYQDVGTPKAGALVLARMAAGGTQLPLLVTENYGRGRTSVFATGGSWRWQMQQPVEDMSHEMFWRQLLRWLVSATPSPVVASIPNARLSDEGGIQLRAEVRDKTYQLAADAQVQARIVGPDGSSETIDLRPEPQGPGLYSVDWNAAKPGSYLAEISAKRGQDQLGSDVLTFRREDGVAENFRSEQDRELLEKLAAETGGHYYSPRNAYRLANEIAYSEAGITLRENKDLWDMPALFFAALGLCAASWLLRRKWGVV